MYTFIIKKKGSTKYVAPLQVQFFDNKQHLFDYISKSNFFPPAKYIYYIFKLWPNYNQEIFNDTIFKKHYKLLYIQEHDKNPSIYPIHYISLTLKQKFTHFLQKIYKFTNRLYSHSSFIIQRFLEDTNDYPVDMKRYSKYNCTIIIDDKNKLSITNTSIEKVINTYNDENYLYMCIKKMQDKKMIYTNICDNYVEAVESVILDIIKAHEFYVLSKIIHLLSDYYIYRINKYNDNLIDIICSGCDDWYENITKLSLLYEKTTLDQSDKELLNMLQNKIKICSERNVIPPSIEKELLSLSSLTSKRHHIP